MACFDKLLLPQLARQAVGWRAATVDVLVVEDQHAVVLDVGALDLETLVAAADANDIDVMGRLVAALCDER